MTTMHAIFGFYVFDCFIFIFFLSHLIVFSFVCLCLECISFHDDVNAGKRWMSERMIFLQKLHFLIMIVLRGAGRNNRKRLYQEQFSACSDLFFFVLVIVWSFQTFSMFINTVNSTQRYICLNILNILICSFLKFVVKTDMRYDSSIKLLLALRNI